MVRVPEAIADEVLTAARRIDEGETVTLSNDRSEALDSATQHENVTQLKELYQKVGELEAILFKARQELQQVAQERDKYFEQIGEIKLELENLKSESVTQSSLTNLPDPATILNRLRKEHKKFKADLKDVELIIELLQAITL